MPAEVSLSGVWDRLAAGYRRQEPLEAASLRAAVEVALPAPDDLVVELGCGPGTLTRRVAALPPQSRPERLVATDPSAPMLAELRRRDGGADAWMPPGWRVVRADAVALPLADGCADLVLCGWLLHVLPDAGLPRVLAEVARVLAPRGRAVAVLPARPRTTAGRAVRRVLADAAEAGGSRAFTELPRLEEALARVGLDLRAERTTSRGYAARVVLASRVS